MTAAICALGLISLLVLREQSTQIAKAQLIYWVIGLPVFILASSIDISFWKNNKNLLYGFSILSLFLLLFLATPIRGSARWFNFGPLRVQPSEIAKFSFVIFLASFYENRLSSKLKTLAISVIFLTVPIFLILREPDIGNALALLAIGAGITIVSGIRINQAIIMAAASLAVILLIFNFLAPYQKQRIADFINPTGDPLGTGYHIIQSKIAVGSGQIFGRGLGRGSQSSLKFLPEAESDFIFASITEQLGALSATIVTCLYAIILTRLLLYLQAAERFAKLVLVGIFSYLLLQVCVNIGMNMGLLPVTGITLPLVSAGGSSLIITLLMLGVAHSVKNRA